MQDPTDIFDYASKNPAQADFLLSRAEAEDSLRDYIPVVWDVLEPGRTFIPGWSVDAICEHLEAITHGTLRKVLINVPPGFMKSLLTSVLWPTWEWGPRNLPWLRYLTASYSAGLSIRDNRKARLVIQSEVYQQMWGDRFELVGDQNAKQKYETDSRGFRLATSVGGVTTGERADRLIIDDPHNVKEAESEAVREDALMWFAEVLPTRVNDPDKTAFLVIMQRVHERDTSGLILAQELGYDHLMLPMEFEPERKCWINFKPTYIEDPKQCEVYYDHKEHAWRDIALWKPEIEGPVDAADLPPPPVTQLRWEGDPRTEDGELLWPERFSRDHLENDLKPSLRSWGGTYAEAGQLQQRPAPRGGGMFQKEDFQYLDPSELTGLRGRVVRGWDLAASDGSDASATASCKMMIDQNGRVIIMDVTTARKMAHGVKTDMKTTAQQDGHTVQQDLPQDPGQAGKAQITDLVKHLHGYDVTSSPESGDKVTRATPLSAQCEGHNLYLVRAPWNDAFVSEATGFPNGAFKDQIDASSRAYSNLVRKSAQIIGFGPKVYEG